MSATMPSWVGSWGGSSAPPVYFFPLEFMAQPTPIQGSLRHRLRLSIAGSRLRVKLSNATGSGALRVGAVSIGLAERGAASGTGVARQTLRAVTFDLQREICLPAGVCAVSDVVELAVGALEEVVVSLYFPQGYTPGCGDHEAAYLEGENGVMRPTWAQEKTLVIRPALSAITVQAVQTAHTLVALGDSITDGSTRMGRALRSWTDVLAQRLHERGGARAYGMVNAGIGGNCLLQSMIGPPALARLDRDVFSLPGLSHLLVCEGINDLGVGGRTVDGVLRPMATLEAMVMAYRQIIERAHEHQVRVIGATLMPFRDGFLFTEEKEQVRLAVNHWIRHSGAFDAVLDFDQVLRDAVDPSRLRAEYDSGDHLHPNEAAQVALGQAIDLGLFPAFR